MTRHYGALLSIVSVMLWAIGLRTISPLLETYALLNAAIPAGLGSLCALGLFLRGRMMPGATDAKTSDMHHKRFVANVAVSLLAALAMLYVDAYAMDGGLLGSVANLFGLGAFKDSHQLAVSMGTALGVVHPLLYLAAGLPRLFGPKH